MKNSQAMQQSKLKIFTQILTTQILHLTSHPHNPEMMRHSPLKEEKKNI